MSAIATICMVLSINVHHLSEQIAQSVIDQKIDQEVIKQLAEIDQQFLISQLDTDQKKLAFWINIYNGFIFSQLIKNAALYEDRSAFFSAKSIVIAGQHMSFDDIEHDILRKATWKYSFGYIRNPFSRGFEETIQVEKLDPRIHFALNCGANSCPPVKVYQYTTIDDQLNTSTKQFLLNNSVYNLDNNSISTTRLFSWFRGDFGGMDGVLKLLTKHSVIPEDKKVEIIFQEYDWTMNVSNFAEK